MFPRYAQPALAELLKSFPVVAVLGVRQCGKTTLCRGLKDFEFFDLEREQDSSLIARDPDLFFQKRPRRVVIDEAQLLPEVFSALRVAVDAHRSEKGRFVITGSSSPDLLDNIAESLAGRVATIELGTLKASERNKASLSPLYSCIAQGEPLDGLAEVSGLKPHSIFAHWLRGGYPEVVEATDKVGQLWFENYHRTYVQRDIRRLFPRLNTQAFRRFSGMLAQLSGTFINVSELGRSLDVTQPTAKQYIDIAHGTFMWRRLTSYHPEPMQRTARMARGHMRDSGLMHHLLNLHDERALEYWPRVGRSWEAFVTEEVIKGMHSTLVPFEAYSYRTRDKAEIDLIIEGGFGTIPIEIKYGTRSDARTLKALRHFVQSNDLPYGIVINNADRVDWLHERIIQIPATLI